MWGSEHQLSFLIFIFLQIRLREPCYQQSNILTLHYRRYRGAMPPSQETPLEKDIANTNLNLDTSESVPSTAKKTPTSNNCLIVSKPPAGEDKGNEVRVPAPGKAVRPLWARLIHMLGLHCLVSPLASYIYSHSGKSKFPFLAGASPHWARWRIGTLCRISKLVR